MSKNYEKLLHKIGKKTWPLLTSSRWICTRNSTKLKLSFGIAHRRKHRSEKHRDFIISKILWWLGLTPGKKLPSTGKIENKGNPWIGYIYWSVKFHPTWMSILHEKMLDFLVLVQISRLGIDMMWFPKMGSLSLRVATTSLWKMIP